MILTCLLSILYLAEANKSPKLEEFKPKRFLNVGSKFAIFCSPHEGSKPFRFEWHKNGHLLSPSSSARSYHIDTSEDDSRLVIESLSPLDSANYSCSVRNDHGSDTQFTVLAVKGLHSISSRGVAHSCLFDFIFCILSCITFYISCFSLF